jgi:hypothetical protein
MFPPFFWISGGVLLSSLELAILHKGVTSFYVAVLAICVRWAVASVATRYQQNCSQLAGSRGFLGSIVPYVGIVFLLSFYLSIFAFSLLVGVWTALFLYRIHDTTSRAAGRAEARRGDSLEERLSCKQHRKSGNI